MKYVKLKEICDLQNGYAFKSSDYIAKSNVLNCRMSNIRPNSNFDIEYSPKYLPEEFVERYREYLLNDGDLVIAMTDLANDPKILGVPTIVNTKGYKLLLNQRVGKLIIKNKKLIDERYLKYALSLPQHRSYYKKFAGGGLQINIGKEHILNIEIPMEEYNNQIKIVNILDKSQELIDKRKEQIEALDELVKSKFIEMFGNPSINDKGWRIDKLSTVVTNIENGKSFVCENFNRSDEYPAILKLSAVTYGVYNANENKALTNEDLFVSSVEVKQGDLLFTRKNTPELVGMSAFVYDTEPNLMMPDLIFRFNTNEKINKIYLWKLINNDLFRGKIKSLSNGSAKSMSNISKQRLMELNIPIPPLELQSKFAEFVKQTVKLKFEMEKSLKELEDNFNSLMQKAFKGELFN